MRKYVHRVGRTARAGREGVAWSLVEKQEVRLLSRGFSISNLGSPIETMPDSGPSFQGNAYNGKPFEPGEEGQGQGD
jgi:superfamily II DNA/RNA helicase